MNRQFDPTSQENPPDLLRQESANHNCDISAISDALRRPPPHGKAVQDFCSIQESLPWLLSQLYWTNADANVFTSGQVPYVITNDGEQARKAVCVYMESMYSAAKTDELEECSYILELGAGTGLFAKLFLDQLKARSLQENVDFYERTKYIVSDGSNKMIEDTSNTGVFSDHEDKIIRLVMRLPGSKTALIDGIENGSSISGSIRAIHANYILDSLPFTILSEHHDGLYELRLQSFLQNSTILEDISLPNLDNGVELNNWMEMQDTSSLTKLQQNLMVEARYFKVDPEDLTCTDAITLHASDSEDSRRIVHSFGAIACTEDAIEMLRDGGYMIAMDYGYAENNVASAVFEFQFFGGSVACGVNFNQLRDYISQKEGYVFIQPPCDPVSLHARMIGREPDDTVIAAFNDEYSAQSWDMRDKPIQDAADLVSRGFYEAARLKFEEAHLLQPYNWALIETIAGFLAYSIEDFSGGMEVAKQGLQLNHLSPQLWNILGDCYYGVGDLDSAEEVYHQATRVNPRDVRGRVNLAYVFLRRGDTGQALRMIGIALALDETGMYRDEILAKQTEALEAMSTTQLRTQLNVGSRLSGHHFIPD